MSRQTLCMIWFVTALTSFPRAATFCLGGVDCLVASTGPQQSGPTLEDVSAKTILEQSPREIMQDFPQLEGLQASADQEDLPMILKKVGENVETYFHNFVSTSAQEEVVQERLRPNGKVEESHKQKFRYLLVSSGRKKDFDLDEYRMDKKGRPAEQKVFSGGTLTKGFASMPALLHPDLQPESKFSFLGRQNENGHDLFVIAFAQDAASAEFREKIVGALGTHTVYLEGLVWIDSTSFQIVRMCTELFPGALPEYLKQQTTAITFGQVHFEGVPTAFWFPQEVVVTTDRLDGRLRNYHRYSDYQLYASQTKMIYVPQ